MGDLGDAYAAMSVQKCPCGAQPQGHPSGLCDACVAKRIVDRPAPTPTPAPGIDLDAVERAERAMTPGEWRADFTYVTAAGGPVATCIGPDAEHDAAGIVALRNAAPALIAEVRALRAEVERLNSERPKIVETAREMRRERDAEIARLTAERDQAVAHRAATNEEIRRLHAVIKVKGFSVEDSIALHETRSEVARLTAELAAARAVPADVEAAIAATNYAMDRDEAADKLRAAFARAISDATAARGTVGGLLATAPVGSIVEWMAGEFRGQSWRRVVVGSDPVNVSCWLAVAERWSDYAVPIASSSFGMPARLAPAHLADLDPATRVPLPKGG